MLEAVWAAGRKVDLPEPEDDDDDAGEQTDVPEERSGELTLNDSEEDRARFRV